MFRWVSVAVLLSVAFGFAAATGTRVGAEDSAAAPPDFAAAVLDILTQPEANDRRKAIDALSSIGTRQLVPYLIEALVFLPSGRDQDGFQKLLRDLTGERHRDVQDWYQWLWNQESATDPAYANFKADLYRYLDPRFEGYFHNRGHTATIRLDEVRWGGVRQDGIPPLRNPEMISAGEAGYLEDDHVVFGLVINDDARAYPKRILAWHEMFTDTVGGVELAGVYCTLCGTVIPFRTRHKGVSHTLGTSGFLYRSNKLMYDQATQSLWSTTRGEPVVGPLVGLGISLEFESVVTTTWGEWRRRHPATLVLSLNTGHDRDYGEGVAYRDYFVTDQLMFNTPFNDRRLKNKQEVLALRFAGAPNQQLAIDTDFLAENPVYPGRIGAQKFVVFTDQTGANRVYDPGNVEFVAYDGRDTVTDKTGESWQLDDQQLRSKDGKILDRLPYHRAFWFGWVAAFPETRLVQ
ncbi:MAG: DUF3179 domain-containing protein [Pseudomonadota bacterium]